MDAWVFVITVLLLLALLTWERHLALMRLEVERNRVALAVVMLREIESWDVQGETIKAGFDEVHGKGKWELSLRMMEMNLP